MKLDPSFVEEAQPRLLSEYNAEGNKNEKEMQ